MDRTTLSLVSAGFLAISTNALAKPPQVRFDMVSVVSCRDVTDDDFASMHPDERLVEAKFEVSSIVNAGDKHDLTEFVFRVTSPHKSFRIADYSPRTRLASDYASGITIEKKRENSKGLGLAVTGGWEAAKVTGHGDAGNKETLTTKYELVAPMESVTASGTIQSGHGVYFKLRPSRQDTLEGAKEYQVVLRVPKLWRGDVIHVHCEAHGLQRGIVRQLDEEVRCGLAEFPVAVYLAGDEQAKSVAVQFSNSNHKLRSLAVTSQQEIKRRSYPTVFHELGGLLEIAEPKIPPTWLQQLLNESVSGHKFENRLPKQVRAAAADYITAKRELRKLRS